MRRRLASAPVSGLPAAAAPVAGFSAQEGTVQSGRIRCRTDILGAERAALVGWVDAGLGVGKVARVDRVEARPVAAGEVEHAIGTELQVADGVARELLTPLVPALDEHLLRAGLVVASRHPHQPGMDVALFVDADRTVVNGCAVGPTS